MKKVAESKTEEEEMKNFEPLQEIITNVQFGYDEGDYGECRHSALDNHSKCPRYASLALQCSCSVIISYTNFRQRQSVRSG